MFHTKIRFENSESKTVTHELAVDTATFGQAENITINSTKEFFHSESSPFEVASISRMKIAGVMNETGYDKFFKVKVNFITIDDSGKEKKIPITYLWGANDVKQLESFVSEELKDQDYEIAQITETKIIEVCRED